VTANARQLPLRPLQSGT